MPGNLRHKLERPIRSTTGVPALSRHTLFTLLGVPWQWTSKAWAFLPSRLGFCTVLALLLLQGESLGTRLVYGVVCALLLVLTQVLHIVGHTIGGKYVGAPMDAALILDTKILTLYENDPPDLPRRGHLGRALGGPLMNIGVGLLALGGLAAFGGLAWQFFAFINLALGVGVMLLPIRGIDGEVIWRELRR